MEIPKRRVVKVKWPCIVCDKECRTICNKKKNVRSIECTVCSGWAHEVCASLTPEAFDFFSHTTSLFVCGRCVSDFRPNKYSYRLGITRYKISILSVCSTVRLFSPTGHAYSAHKKKMFGISNILTGWSCTTLLKSLVKLPNTGRLQPHGECE